MRLGCLTIVGLLAAGAAVVVVRGRCAPAVSDPGRDAAVRLRRAGACLDSVWNVNRPGETRAIVQAFRPPRYAAFAGAAAAVIPFRDGLAVIHAQSQPGGRGDFEAVASFQRLAGDTIALLLSAAVGDTSVHNEYAFLASALSNSTVYSSDQCYTATCFRTYNLLASGYEIFPTDYLTWHLSGGVLEELRRAGRAEVTYVWDSNMNTAMFRVMRPGRVTFPVIVNGSPGEVPALHIQARLEGNLTGDSIDMHVLDDSRNALILERWHWRRAKAYLSGRRTVQLTFPSGPRIEAELARSRHAVIYGIYFAFASSRILPASEPVLRELAGTLVRNPEWRLRIEGHTDSIGGWQSNIRLSRRRAEAVKAVLVERFGIDAGRLRVAGFGSAVPIDSNSTLLGRARNRRVELIRE